MRTTYLTAGLCAAALTALAVAPARPSTYRFRTPAPAVTVAPARVTLPVWTCEPDGSFCSASTTFGGETVSLVRNADGSTFVTFTNPAGTGCGSFGLDAEGAYFAVAC